MRQWISVYVESDEDAEQVLIALKQAQLYIPTLEWDEDWDTFTEDDDDNQEGKLEALQCPICQHMNHWDNVNCTACGANLRVETESDDETV